MFSLCVSIHKCEMPSPVVSLIKLPLCLPELLSSDVESQLYSYMTTSVFLSQLRHNSRTSLPNITYLTVKCQLPFVIEFRILTSC